MSNQDETTWAKLRDEIISCRRCPRLVTWREEMALEKRASFRDETYWGKPVPGFGDSDAQLVVIGLAPAAHGANRTGRMFTGDRSGEWLYRALYKAGFANQPTSSSIDDGLVLNNCFITAAVRCAPPNNKPSMDERNNCSSYLARELELLRNAQVLLALGSFAFDALARTFNVTPRPKFTHGAAVRLERENVIQGVTLMGSYHPSQQNTFTGKLTEPMFDEIFSTAAQLISEA